MNIALENLEILFKVNTSKQLFEMNVLIIEMLDIAY